MSMPPRPAKLVRLFRATLSIVLGILIELGFVFWFVIIIWGTAASVLILWQMVA